MKSKSKLKIVNHKPMVDLETGEVVSVPQVKTITYVERDKEKFYLTYASFINAITKGSVEKSELQVYAYLLENYGCSVDIPIIMTIKTNIAIATGLSVGTIGNTIAKLCSKPAENEPLLIKSGKATYRLNPQYAFNGSSKDRLGEFKVLIDLQLIEQK